MKLTKDEQTRLENLQGKKSEDLSDEEKAELKTLQDKLDSYEGDLSQERFNAMYAENKANREKARLLKEENDRLLKAQKDAEDEEKRKKGEVDELYKAEKKKNEALEAENKIYREANLAKWQKIKATLPPKLAGAFKDDDSPEIVSANLAEYEKYIELGFIDADGKISGGGSPPGGFEKYTWKDLQETPGLATKVFNEDPELYEKLRRESKNLRK